MYMFVYTRFGLIGHAQKHPTRTGIALERLLFNIQIGYVSATTATKKGASNLLVPDTFCVNPV